jgi:tetratricopeptide (TPR) repeat protein
VQDLARAHEVIAELGDPAAQVDVLLDEATVRDWLEDFHRSRELAEQAQALAGAMPDGPGALLEARLTMARARSACRFNESSLSADLFLEAAARAESLGDAAYETYVISLALGGYVLAGLGRLDEAEAAFDRVIPLARARGDRMHLTAALANRQLLWGARHDADRMLADVHGVLEIAREVGNPRSEYCALQSMALCLHWLGRGDEAESYARRAIEVDDRQMGTSAHLEGRLLLARILAVRGDPRAAEVLADIRARHEGAQLSGRREATLLPAEEVVFKVLSLALHGGAPAEWQALEAEARKFFVGYDLDEVERFARAATSSG